MSESNLTTGTMIFFAVLSVLAFITYIVFTVIFALKFAKIAKDKGYRKLKTAVCLLCIATVILSVLPFINMITGPKVLPAIVLVLFAPASAAFFVIEILIIVFEDKNINSKDPSGCSNKSRKADTLLCFLLGGLGVHRYYEGKIASGVLWTLTDGLFGIGYLVDILIVLSGKSTDRDGKAILLWETADKRM